MTRIAKLSLAAAGGLAVLVTTGSATVYGVSARKLARTYEVPAVSLAVPAADAATIARGEHLVTSMTSCQECHGLDLGGGVMMEDAAMGFIAAPNLTPGRGGVGAEFELSDWVRAIRYGVGRDGRSLLIMPSEAYAGMSDEDLGAVIAYLRQVPAVDREFAPRRVGPLGRALIAAGQIEMIAEKVAHRNEYTRVEADATVEYGRYLAGIGGCTSCHKPDLSGGLPGGPPGAPLSANLTKAGIGDWSEADFVRAMREGKRPDGSEISEFMPWRFSGRMTDEELHAVWLFMQSLPAVETTTK